MEIIQERVGHRIPVIGVGSLYGAEEALHALEKSCVPLIALGRQLIIDPDWVEKI
jgi:2,4-dienoyl-CoA reductase-like NADH-dependent reductase (Old Yellow Enzyme family)